jgi:hypothetical protein
MSQTGEFIKEIKKTQTVAAEHGLVSWVQIAFNRQGIE